METIIEDVRNLNRGAFQAELLLDKKPNSPTLTDEEIVEKVRNFNQEREDNRRIQFVRQNKTHVVLRVSEPVNDVWEKWYLSIKNEAEIQ